MDNTIRLSVISELSRVGWPIRRDDPEAFIKLKELLGMIRLVAMMPDEYLRANEDVLDKLLNGDFT